MKLKFFVGRETVRRTCIEENWYTHGYTEDYVEMLNSVPETVESPEELRKIAENIMDNSDMGIYYDNGYTETEDILKCIIGAILRNSTVIVE